MSCEEDRSLNQLADLTYLDGDCPLEVLPSTRLSRLCTPDDQHLCALARLGHYNAGLMQANQEGCTFFCSDSPCYDYREQYRWYYTRDSAHVWTHAEFSNSPFHSYGDNCTYYYRQENEGGTHYDLNEVCGSELTGPDYDIDDDGSSDFACVETLHYIQSSDSASSADVDWKSVYDYYDAYECKSSNRWGCECSSDESCDPLGSLICKNAPSDSTKDRSQLVCMPQAFCLPDAQGTQRRTSQYHQTSLLGYFQDNSRQQYVLKFMEDQAWWPWVTPRLGCLLTVVSYTFGTGQYQGLRIQVLIDNQGYSAPLYRRPFKVITQEVDNSASRKEYEISADVRMFQPACPSDWRDDKGICVPQAITRCPEGWQDDQGNCVPPPGFTGIRRYLVTVDIPAGDLTSPPYNIGIWLPDADDQLKPDSKFSIRLAGTRTSWDDTTGINWIKETYNRP